MIEKAGKAVAQSLRPPSGGEDPGPWRRKVWLSLLAIIAILAIHFAWDSGYGKPFGLTPVVRADQLDDRMGKVEGRLDTIEGKQNQSLKLALAQEICRLFHLRNAADSGSQLREQLDKSFEEKQTEFATINRGARYSVAECSPP